MFRALNVTNVAKVLCKTGREPKSVYGLFYILKFERVVILFINSFFLLQTTRNASVST